MSRTDQERYDQAHNYLKTVDVGLATDVHSKLAGRAVAVGAEISLGGAGYWKSGSSAQHTAVRALLLCQIAYFRPPHCRADLATTIELNKTRTEFLGKPQIQVNDEIKTYCRLSNRTLKSIADAARTADQPGGNLDFLRIKRTERNLGMNIICYNGVTVWLYVSGFVSKRWLAGPGNKIDANNADTAFGASQVVPVDKWHTIPEGYLWSVQRKGDPTTCHWGVSLGNNLAAATNNTPGSLAMTLKFKSGGGLYGTFNFVEICTMLNSTVKYGNSITIEDPINGRMQQEAKDMPSSPDKNIVVKMLNPMTSAAMF